MLLYSPELGRICGMKCFTELFDLALILDVRDGVDTSSILSTFMSGSIMISPSGGGKAQAKVHTDALSLTARFFFLLILVFFTGFVYFTFTLLLYVSGSSHLHRRKFCTFNHDVSRMKMPFFVANVTYWYIFWRWWSSSLQLWL